MPLFNFNYEGEEYKFSDIYTIKGFDPEKDIPKNCLDGISKIGLSQISLENKALIAESPDFDYYKSEINLLLLAFKIYACANVLIKWRFCDENQTHSTMLNDTYRNLLIDVNEFLSESDLDNIKTGFHKLKEMYAISARMKNAIFFLWQSFHIGKHVGVYVFLTCALEALFSGESRDKPTSILLNRISSFVEGDSRFSKTQIDKIYDVRSDMVHGRIKHTDKKELEERSKNLEKLAKLEALVFTCFRKFLDEEIYLKFNDEEEKESYLNNLTNKNR